MTTEKGPVTVLPAGVCYPNSYLLYEFSSEPNVNLHTQSAKASSIRFTIYVLIFTNWIESQKILVKYSLSNFQLHGV